MRLLAAILAAAAGLSAQTPDFAPETILLSRFLVHMRELLQRQPDYTCVETVERTQQPAGDVPQVEDTLRIEVALVDNKEMFAWPGSKEFLDTKPRELVATGMFGNGSFALYTRILFGGAGPPFEYRGEEQIDGRTVARYDFRVPRSRRLHKMTMDDREDYVGYYGSAFIDVATLDLRRIHITFDEIPPDLGLTAADDQVDYGQVRIGEEDFLLPVESAMMSASPEIVSRNRTRFTSCRKFVGQSELVFVDSDFAAPQAPPVAVQEVTLPPNLRLGLILDTHVDLQEGFVGDAVEAHLRADVKQDGRILVPKDAVARGRVVRLERRHDSYITGIQWTSLEWPGGHARLNLAFQGIGPTLPGQPVLRDPYGDLQIPRPGRQSLDHLLLYWRTVE